MILIIILIYINYKSDNISDFSNNNNNINSDSNNKKKSTLAKFVINYIYCYL